ncbi:unnamed protein product [Medioppia subpectinata]|uniref:C2H2-type domain-containing protein n=1 Tax=Medioppia subpectinata TaxID=1979941 RepID=A0A7R9KBH6_9ACAR|nr:unnamed protein product [Medioppia subpectinata]CAG2100049.1 unnamed protein product [Medioppia subpectinata]
MSQTNVIITSGSRNQIIHVPVVTSTTRSATPIEIVTSSSATVTINRTNQSFTVNHNNNGNNVSNNATIYSPAKSLNRSFQSPPPSAPKNVINNREQFSGNDDNCEVKALYFNKETNHTREQLLLPTDTYIKQEELDDEEEYEEYEEDEEEGLEGIANSKTQYQCSGCGKGFCYTGWLDRHKLSSPACRDAHPIHETFNAVHSEPTNYSQTLGNISGGNGGDRSRPSLEGRLRELLCCPNENCNFVTHWVQSLNKHVFGACKYGKSTGNGNDNVVQSSPTAKKGVQNCHICGKQFVEAEAHIQHMKSVHQIKLFYQCSECKINFDNKHESEAHIEEHSRLGKFSAKEKLVSTPIKSDTNGVGNGSQQYWKCELCHKSYLSVRAYEIHRTSCEKEMQSSTKGNGTPSPQRSPQRHQPQPLRPLAMARPTAGRPVGSGVRNALNENTVKHFKREQIEAIHGNDFRCRYCRKAFDNSYGLCNHLSRRPFCREWYYKAIPQELKKNNSLHLMKNTKRSRIRNIIHRQSSAARQPSPGKQTPIQSGDDIVYSRQQRKGSLTGRSRNALPPWTNSARCDRCRKVFVGKNPTVALTNHLRGSTCLPTKYNPFQKPQVIRSRTLAGRKPAVPRNTYTTNATANDGQNRTVAENRFYCKLCPRIELKNRVSLGCHLTIYHGLPQVNVSTGKGDGFRCQNCSQIFESKYFYNLHRQDCDLTSAYVGMVSSNESFAANKQSSLSKDGSTITCDLCGKTGITNASQLNIHQKYQCVRRLTSNRVTANVKKFTPTATTKDSQKPVMRSSELARLNDRAKNEPNLTMCEACGRGPYNSYYYFMEHKKKYCSALSNETTGRQSGPQNKAKKSFVAEDRAPPAEGESFCLNPTVPRARKTMNYTNVSSPAQMSQSSSAAAVAIGMDTNGNESEEVVISVSEVTKCTICAEEFDDVLQFIRHRLSHITQELIQNESIDALDCELCGARVHHYQRIQQHLILHLQNVQILKKKNLIEVTKKSLEMRDSEAIDQSDDEDIDGGDDSLLHCPYCKSEQKSRAELANHIKTTCPYRYQCSNCNKTYMTKESYVEHRDECTKNTAINRIASKAPKFKCRNCGLEFRIKQQLLWHEHACNKVYTADHSGRVEEVIERTLSCSVCGLVSDVYESKVRHESKCLNRYLAVIGNSTEEIKSNGEQIIKPLSILDNIDLTSLSDSSESSEVPEALIQNLKEEFGIRKDVKVVLNAFDEEIVRRLKTDLYCERDESIQYETLKESFLTLVRRLIKNDEVLREMSQEPNAEIVLSRMLKYLGEQVIDHNGLNELNCFRQNLQTFLKLTIKDDTLILAYRDAESVDEAIINMLNFECELHC